MKKQRNHSPVRLLPLLLIFAVLTACTAKTVTDVPPTALITPASQSQPIQSNEVSSVSPSEISPAVSSRKTSFETPAIVSEASSAPSENPDTVVESGSYTTKEDVALYLHLFGHLPGNFITKSQASALGWTGGGLEPYASGKCIGGDYFGNYEGLLPDKDGRKYTECDIGTLGASSRGAKRIVFSNDGLIYYTADHYESFTLLYGDPNL